MNIPRTSLYLTFLSAGIGLAAGQSLNIKPGQWETSMTTAGVGSPALGSLPPDLLEKLPPEQRAKLEEKMKAANSPRTTVTPGCVTKEDVAKGFQPSALPGTCSYQPVLTTGNKIKTSVTCATDKTKITGTVEVEAIDSEHVHGTTQMQFSGQPTTVTSNFTSKWVGPVCTEKK